MALEVKLGNIEQNVSQMNKKPQELRKEQINQQQVIDNLSNVVRVMSQDIVRHHDNIQEIFNQFESVENNSKKTMLD